MAPPAADLVIVYKASAKTKQEALDAENDYTELLAKIRRGGYNAVGRRGNKDEQVLILISAPDELLAKVVQAERYRDFIHGVPSFTLPSVARNYASDPLSNGERVRYAHSYLTGAITDGGLGIAPGAQGCGRVQSIMALHDHEFNEQWVDSWTTRKLGLGFNEMEIEKVKAHFGEQLALYFAFLTFYARYLVVPSILGAIFFFTTSPYHPAYSILLSLWSVFFVEAWRIRERSLSVIWGSYACSRVEHRRSEFRGAGNANDATDDALFPWWKREIRVAAGLPVIAFFATALTALLTGIFIVEAFVTQLYAGPGAEYAGLLPTGLFILLVPRLVGFYQGYATGMTEWENHVYRRSYDHSLSLKTFALANIVAYGGLYLSTFVYVPFGEQIMTLVQTTLFATQQQTGANVSQGADTKNTAVHEAKKVLNPDRLKNQVFAYLVTNQVIGQFLELGVPFILRFVYGRKEQKEKVKKTVAFKDEKSTDVALRQRSEQELEFVSDVRGQVKLPDYDVFGDYSEMVTQFGYVTLWSTCYSLTPIGALVNNWFELRGDAIKIAKLGRRPIPRRVDSIGPWLDILSFLSWQGALINSALVYLFYHPLSNNTTVSHIYPMSSNDNNSTSTAEAASINTGDAEFLAKPMAESFASTLRSAVLPAIFIALATSHGFFLVRAFVRHILERALWRGSQAQVKLERSERDVKQSWLQEVGGSAQVKGTEVAGGDVNGAGGANEMPKGFWSDDEGLDEIRRNSKAM